MTEIYIQADLELISCCKEFIELLIGESDENFEA